jgi:hypothetical protein
LRSGCRGRRFFFAAQNLAHRVARLRDLRPVDLWFLPVAAAAMPRIGAASAPLLQIRANTLRLVTLE